MDQPHPIPDAASQVETLPAEPLPPNRTMAVAVWVVLASLLLGTSAVVRMIQERRHKEESNSLTSCPFPLNSLPRTLGRWKSEVVDQKLDSKTLLITGGKEYTIRTYSDDLTGVRLLVLLLFGPVEPVTPHVPEACYPANGYSEADRPLNRKITYSYVDAAGKVVGDQDANFRSAVYKKASLIEGSYYSFRYDGVWSPVVGSGQKIPRKNMGVYKLQIQRLVAPGESRDTDKYPEPIEDFLRSFLPVFEHQMSVSTTSSAAGTPDQTALLKK